MIEYSNLKNCYIAAIQMGLSLGLYNPKQGNELLHKFCEELIENSNYKEQEKQIMKHELEVLKQTLAMEIDSRS